MVTTTPATPSAEPLYQVNWQHRNKAFSMHKSQWTILINDEVAVFNLAHQRAWQCSKQNYWGIHLTGMQPLVLGVSPMQHDCHVAKFVGYQNVWHGYPVAHWIAPFDRPGVNVLNAWYKAGYINKAARRKITQGKRCVL